MLARLALNLRQHANEVAVQVKADSLILSGRGLARRWMLDPELRFLGRSGR